MFLIWRTSAPNYKKKSTALKLYCVCDCSRMAVEWVLSEEIFCQNIIFFALTPVFSVDFLQYSLVMTLKYGILSQSTAVFPQSVENVVNTRSCMKKINTVIYRETGII